MVLSVLSIKMCEEGSVKFFNEQKGFGFIVRDSEKPDVFVHFKSIKMDGYKTLCEGQRVRFNVSEGRKGPQADDVEPLDFPQDEGGRGGGRRRDY